MRLSIRAGTVLYAGSLVLATALPALAQKASTGTVSGNEPPPWFERKLQETFGRAVSPISRGLHIAGVEIGTGLDTDADLLKPYFGEGFDYLLAWDSRIVVNDQGVGLHAQYRRPQFFQKLAASFTEKSDVFAALGLGVARNDAYRTVKLHPMLPPHGFNVGLAAVLSPYLGFTTGYDRSKTYGDGNTVFNRRVYFGAGVTPLGANHGKHWNVSLLPTLYYDWVDDLNKGVPDKRQDPGWSIGPEYYYSLARFRLPWMFQRLRPDRFDTSLIYGDTEIGGYVTTLSANVTGFCTSWLRVFLGTDVDYYNVVQHWAWGMHAGVSLRLTLLDFPI